MLLLDLVHPNLEIGFDMQPSTVSCGSLFFLWSINVGKRLVLPEDFRRS
jgi:hypothetical protein